ncbi:hypothetical protein KCU85_g2244, partial [Aureobasidium melanogenum]
MSHFDVAVVGLGALGSAAAYQASKKGAKVIAFEQFEFGHVRGASHDTSRIIRTSYDQPEYVALAKAAYKDWAQLETESGQRLVTITGGLIFLPKHGELGVQQYAESLEANGIPFELLNHEQVSSRWPQFSIPEDFEAVYTADSGIGHAARSVTAMQFLARFKGAVLHERTKVERIIPKSAGGVSIQTSKGRFSADKVILATDAWTNELLAPLGEHIPLEITQQQVTYYKPTNPGDFEGDKFPVWILGGELWYYGFPCYGEPTIKAAEDNAPNYTTLSDRTFVPSKKLLERLTGAMDKLIPDEKRQVLRTVTCQYTITPDRQFVLSPTRSNKDIIVALGAAHGFKFAPTIGRVAAELALDGETGENISKFGIPVSDESARARL